MLNLIDHISHRVHYHSSWAAGMLCNTEINSPVGIEECQAVCNDIERLIGMYKQIQDRLMAQACNEVWEGAALACKP